MDQIQKLLALCLDSVEEGIGVIDLDGVITFSNPAAARMLGWDREEIIGKDVTDLVPRGPGIQVPAPARWPLFDSLRNGTIRNRSEAVFWTRDGAPLQVEYTSSPIRDEDDRIIGAVINFKDNSARRRAAEQTRHRIEKLTALRAIDAAILSCHDLDFTLRVVVDQVLIYLGGNAAAIYLMDAATQSLTLAARRGFIENSSIPARLRLGEGLAGGVAQAGRALYGMDLREQRQGAGMLDRSMAEEFCAYDGVPLVARGELKGVLEVFHRAEHAADEDWIGFLETIAGQAAIAIDYGTLLSDLLRANREITQSYDATIEGWARALDLRDHETVGHSARVTEMTLRLAEAMGFTGEDLVHVRRGALLHDIGKMGVPDSILFKEGELTTEEWQVMCLHPQHAHDLLYPIPFLRPAIDIPLFHHEKWDGTGYPHGLSGNQIPLPARIFAVVDVWDALRSDRPYRKGWSEQEVVDHLRELSGTHFDPAVAEAFLRVLERP